MTPRIKKLRQYLLDGKHREHQHEVDWKSLLPRRRRPSRCTLAADCIQTALQEEARTPVFLPDERIAGTRCCANSLLSYVEEIRGKLRKEAYFNALGVPTFSEVLHEGLDVRRSEALARKKRAFAENDAETVDFLNAVIRDIDAILRFADAYRAAAESAGLTELAELLTQVPHKPARTFHEALQFLRILYFALCSKGTYHNGVGRFDQYLWPYLQHDLKAKTLTKRAALELLEEFLLTFLRDGDEMVLTLGGLTPDGSDAENPLTELCQKAVEELQLETLRCQLRGRNPQMPYQTDEAVISALEYFGYEPEDARNYTLTPDGEILVPGREMDLPNIARFSFTALLRDVLASPEAQVTDSFTSLLHVLRTAFFATADHIAASLDCVEVLPCPLISMLSGQIASGRDLGVRGKYHNFGIRGTDFLEMVNTLQLVSQVVFTQKLLTLEDFANRLTSGTLESFLNSQSTGTTCTEGQTTRLTDLDARNPAMDALAIQILQDFADSWKNRTNCHGGLFRPSLRESTLQAREYLTEILPTDSPLRYLTVF